MLSMQMSSIPASIVIPLTPTDMHITRWTRLTARYAQRWVLLSPADTRTELSLSLSLHTDGMFEHMQ